MNKLLMSSIKTYFDKTHLTPVCFKKENDWFYICCGYSWIKFPKDPKEYDLDLKEINRENMISNMNLTNLGRISSSIDLLPLSISPNITTENSRIFYEKNVKFFGINDVKFKYTKLHAIISILRKLYRGEEFYIKVESYKLGIYTNIENQIGFFLAYSR